MRPTRLLLGPSGHSGGLFICREIVDLLVRTWHDLESPSSSPTASTSGRSSWSSGTAKSGPTSRGGGSGPARRGPPAPQGAPWAAPTAHRSRLLAPTGPPGPLGAEGCLGGTDRPGSSAGAGAWCEGNGARVPGPTGRQAGRARSGRSGPAGPSRTARSARHGERGAGGARPGVPAPRSTA